MHLLISEQESTARRPDFVLYFVYAHHQKSRTHGSWSLRFLQVGYGFGEADLQITLPGKDHVG